MQMPVQPHYYKKFFLKTGTRIQAVPLKEC